MHDLLNQKFGKLLIIEKAPYNKNRQDMWKCKCDCGNIKTIMGAQLRRGTTKSCGCLVLEINSLDLVGVRSGKLVALEKKYSLKDKGRGCVWLCKCDCGQYTEVRATCIKRKTIKSCGCSNFDANIRKRKYSTVEEASYRSVYTRYQKNAVIRNINFEITFEDFQKLLVQNCFYCDEKPSRKIQLYKHTFVEVNGVDRINNSLGYMHNNCVSCCTICNKLKSNLDLKELKNMNNRLNNIILKLENTK